MSTVAIIDYGMGNIHSIAKALQYADARVSVKITADKQTLLNADRIVLPGVGAIRDCMLALQANNLCETLYQLANTKPFLGICLGLQALLTYSAENDGIEGLNLISGQVKHFPEQYTDEQGQALKIPHMGWNQVQQNIHPLWADIAQNSHFYFVHSYYAQPDKPHNIAGVTEYAQTFAAALTKDNIFATQFHPEKSHTAGLQLLQNFLKWDGQA